LIENPVFCWLIIILFIIHPVLIHHDLPKIEQLLKTGMLYKVNKIKTLQTMPVLLLSRAITMPIKNRTTV